MKRVVNALVKLFATSAMVLSAQTFTTVFNFDAADGSEPGARLVQGADGSLYGTTIFGGASDYGTAFKITTGGKLTTLYSFCAQTACADGQYPVGLVLATDGDFYGTAGGGAYRDGTVFKIAPTGTLTTLFSFCAHGGLYCPDGSSPNGLVQGADGDFYGTTSGGGVIPSDQTCYGGCGTIFKVTPRGALTTLYRLCSQPGCADGAGPTGLIQAADGNFYGTTGGGAYGSGEVFKITPSGTLSTVYSFCAQSGCSDGDSSSALVQAIDGDFYGTTYRGGANGFGTIFKITPGGTLTTLHGFCSESGCVDGAAPYAVLMQATNGNPYGTTLSGGAGNHGTLFEVTPGGTLTTVYSFCAQGDCHEGPLAEAALVQDTNGDLYGTTLFGGPASEFCEHLGCGTVFRLSFGLEPFVKTLPRSGQVGAAIRILGTDLADATSVSFAGTPAVFQVVSATEIATVVPAGAATGKIQVAAPGGTLDNAGLFFVHP
jgi:uncharacterized repeat protein (TIGR03803 family)